MAYLSPQIEVLAKKKRKEEGSLIKKEYSCGIFQDYGHFSQDLQVEKQ